LLALAAALIIAGGAVVIYINPYITINPYPPLELPAEIVLPSPTIQPIVQPEPTAEAEVEQTSTAVPAINPTSTQVWQTTPTQPAGTVQSIIYDFELRGSASGISASQYDPSRTCDWMGIAGQVTDLQGTPVRGIRVVLQGRLEDRQIDLISMSGTDLRYGPAGFEFFLGEKPIASSDQITVQLIDQAGLPLSAKIPIETYSECDKNLVWLDFVEVR